MAALIKRKKKKQQQKKQKTNQIWCDGVNILRYWFERETSLLEKKKVVSVCFFHDNNYSSRWVKSQFTAHFPVKS